MWIYCGFLKGSGLCEKHLLSALKRASASEDLWVTYSLLPADGDWSTGMLVVESVVPGGPADGVLEPGDVLVRLQGQVSSA